MRIFLIRHGQSQGNVDPSAYISFGDPAVPVTDEGWRQALRSGEYLRKFLENRGLPEPECIWVSSFLRTKQTLSGVIDGMERGGKPVTGRICEDLRLAEQSFGYLPYMQTEKGWFRRKVGEALAAFPAPYIKAILISRYRRWARRRSRAINASTVSWGRCIVTGTRTE